MATCAPIQHDRRDVLVKLNYLRLTLASRERREQECCRRTAGEQALHGDHRIGHPTARVAAVTGFSPFNTARIAFSKSRVVGSGRALPKSTLRSSILPRYNNSPLGLKTAASGVTRAPANRTNSCRGSRKAGAVCLNSLICLLT